jgi:hypothetical protein
MEPCTACGEKHLHHTVTEAEKQCVDKLQLELQAILWQPQNRKTHIKRKKVKTAKQKKSAVYWVGA